MAEPAGGAAPPVRSPCHPSTLFHPHTDTRYSTRLADKDMHAAIRIRCCILAESHVGLQRRTTQYDEIILLTRCFI